MFKEEIVQKLTELAEGYLQAKGVDLIDITCRRDGRELAIMILVDFPAGGITLGECAGLNRGIGNLIEEGKLLAEGYILEVSSPGLDRPLRTPKDFARCRGKAVRFFFKEAVDGKWEQEGIINKVEGDFVYADIAGEIIAVPLSKIATGKQKIK